MLCSTNLCSYLGKKMLFKDCWFTGSLKKFYSFFFSHPSYFIEQKLQIAGCLIRKLWGKDDKAPVAMEMEVDSWFTASSQTKQETLMSYSWGQWEVASENEREVGGPSHTVLHGAPRSWVSVKEKKKNVSSPFTVSFCHNTPTRLDPWWGSESSQVQVRL